MLLTVLHGCVYMSQPFAVSFPIYGFFLSSFSPSSHSVYYIQCKCERAHLNISTRKQNSGGTYDAFADKNQPLLSRSWMASWRRWFFALYLPFVYASSCSFLRSCSEHQRQTKRRRRRKKTFIIEMVGCNLPSAKWKKFIYYQCLICLCVQIQKISRYYFRRWVAD